MGAALLRLGGLAMFHGGGKNRDGAHAAGRGLGVCAERESEERRTAHQNVYQQWL